MQKTAFNDNWYCNGIPVTLPHDAMIHEIRNAQAACGSAGAFFPEGSYMYRKTFPRPDAAHVLLQFEGVYRNAKVFINEREAGGAAYGYIPFFIEADEYLIEGENSIRVECAVQHPDSRWYTGAGIYRPVWLWTGPKDSIRPESVMISTVSYDPAVINVKSEQAVSVTVGTVKGKGTDFDLPIPDAKCWSDETPNLYTAKITNGSDEAEIRFGIRKIEWSNKGLFINGRSALLRGGCIHHDNGILGAAAYDESEFRRVKKLKSAGFNAIRSSHNPCSRAMLEACDELGVYLIDETWDMWYSHKSRHDYASEFMEHYRGDIRAMVARDFNHPSVIMYSIGNEVSEPAQEKGVALAKEMVDYIHSLDRNRAVTGGINLMIISRSAKGNAIYKEDGGRNDSGEKKTQGMSSTMFNLMTSVVGPGMNKGANGKKADTVTSPVLDALDIAGYNYASGRYPLEAKAHPDRVIFGSETFPQDIAKNWAMVKQYPYLIGDFMWTAWDYLGEAGIGAWAYTSDGKSFDKPYPWLLGNVGAMDILGDPNGELFHAQAVWGLSDKPMIAVQPVNHPGVRPAKSVWRGTNAIPSWSWKGCEGNKAVVEVYSGAASIELILNGKSIGRKKVKACKASFKTRYMPGTLTAIAFGTDGQELSRNELISAGEASVKIQPETIEAKTGEILYVPVYISDAVGVVESNADTQLKVTVENGELLGFGSANPRTEERFDAGEYTTFYGHALAVVRAGKAGTLTLTIGGVKKDVKVHGIQGDKNEK